MSDPTPDTRLAALAAKWREEADGVTAMGYSQQGDRMRDCANELDAALLAAAPDRALVEKAQDETWAGAVTYVRDMAKTIRNLVNRLVADGAIAELATVRAEALEECADGMERAAKKARAAFPLPAPVAGRPTRQIVMTEEVSPEGERRFRNTAEPDDVEGETRPSGTCGECAHYFGNTMNAFSVEQRSDTYTAICSLRQGHWAPNESCSGFTPRAETPR